MSKETIANPIHDGQAHRRAWSENQKGERDEVSDFQKDGIGKITTNPETYLRYINAQAMNPHMSAGNIAAALVQKENVKMLATVEKWTKQGRTLNKNEEHDFIRMLVPQEKNPQFYEVIEVFDITQTSGRVVEVLTLKEGTSEMETAIKNLSRYAPAKIEFCEMQGAIYDSASRTIYISPELSQSETFAALATEVAHAKIHKAAGESYDRATYDLDAQSIGYILSTRFRIETQAPNVSGVKKSFKEFNADERREVLNSIRNMSKQMGNSIEKEINPPQRANARGAAGRNTQRRNNPRRVRA